MQKTEKDRKRPKNTEFYSKKNTKRDRTLQEKIQNATKRDKTRQIFFLKNLAEKRKE